MILADLLDDPALGLRLLSADRHRATAVLAAHVSELPHPGPWLEGGELLMTTGWLVPNAPADWAAFVAEIAAGGISALALGLGDDLPHSFVPASLIAACAERDLPLLSVSPAVPFIAVTKAVFAGLADEQQEVLRGSAELGRDLTLAAASGGGLEAMTRTWSAAADTNAQVHDRLGRPLVAGAPADLEIELTLTQMRDEVLRTGTSQTRTDPESGFTLAARPLATSEIHGCLSFASHRQPDEHSLSVLIALVSLELDRRWLVDAPERERRAEALRRLLQTEDDVRATSALMSFGIQSDRTQMCVVDVSSSPNAAQLLIDLALRLPGGLIRRIGDRLELVVEHDAALRASIESLLAGLPTGFGVAVTPGGLHASLRQAYTALEVSRHTGEAVEFTDGGAHRFLLDLADPEFLLNYSSSVLAPLASAERGDTLIETLETYLTQNCSIDATAEALGVHRHTVRNRIHKITELTHRSLDSVDHQCEMWLALKARARS
ncbi:PucR family transcriptional regulator [Aeromicrobium sp. P5_D10]